MLFHPVFSPFSAGELLKMKNSALKFEFVCLHFRSKNLLW